jgi:hypothetical protein
LELFDSQTGETQVHIDTVQFIDSDENPNAQSNASPIIPFHVGLVPGQALRINIVGSEEADLPGQSRRAVVARAVLFDAQGNQIAQSEECAIAPGKIASFVFNRGDLALAGEPGTGRLQGIASYLLTVDGVDGTAQGVSASLELIDGGTGRTTILVSQKPKEIVVVSSKLPRQ